MFQLSSQPRPSFVYEFSNGISPFQRTIFNDKSFFKYPPSYETRAIIWATPLGAAFPVLTEAYRVSEEDIKSFRHPLLVRHQVNLNDWSKYMTRLNSLQESMTLRECTCWDCFLCLSIVGWYFAYQKTKALKAHNQSVRDAFLAEFNQVVLEPKGLFAKLQIAEWISWSGEHQTTSYLKWITITSDQQDIHALKKVNETVHIDNIRGQWVYGCRDKD